MVDNSLTRPVSPVRTPLDEVVTGLGARLHGESRGVLVTGLSLASQQVRPGDLYAALPGTRAHGADYAAQAVGAGAVAVLTDADGLQRCPATLSVPVLEVDSPRAVLGALAAWLYGDPASTMTLLGVTGTQGKTTTTRMLESALTASGLRAAVVGTVGTRIAGEDVHSTLTTPEAPDLHALFAVMSERRVRACAMEVSSHALVMGRVDGVCFDAAAFLNLGRDHLDFHEDMESYFAAKASLFTPRRCRRAVTNTDDEYGRRLLRAPVPVVAISPSGADADWRAEDVVVSPRGSTFTVHAPDGARYPVRVPMPGDFNVANALAAVAVAAEAGLDPAAVSDGIGRGPGVPGRLERVEAGQDFLAIVDYAHKPDALTAALHALRPLTAGRLVLVLGAGGDRDTGKRPAMGEIGARLADVLVVTDDNPRTEDAGAIRSSLLAGARRVPEPERAQVHEVGDRGDAIRAAVSMARPGDTVLVAGKGHETGQQVGDVVHPFDDRAQVRAALEAR